jgi:hypothetical protein
VDELPTTECYNLGCTAAGANFQSAVNQSELAHVALRPYRRAGLATSVPQGRNRRESVFSEDGDHAIYLYLASEQAQKAHLEVWVYCLMPNHVYMIVTLRNETGFAQLVKRPGAGQIPSMRAAA